MQWRLPKLIDHEVPPARPQLVFLPNHRVLLTRKKRSVPASTPKKGALGLEPEPIVITATTTTTVGATEAHCSATGPANQERSIQGGGRAVTTRRDETSTTKASSLAPSICTNKQAVAPLRLERPVGA